jgi:hypothetical protein
VGDQPLQVRHGELAELATRQHGVVATRQLDALGYSKSSVAKAATAGRLHRVHRGVYAVGHRELSWEGRCMAAVLASYPSVASHLSAGWLWGLLRSRPGTVHVTSPSPRPGKRPFVVHRADLAPVDRTILDGVPVTSLRKAGLPEPAMNVFVAGHELDAYWEEARFGVELDAWETHKSRLSFEEDRERTDDFLHAEIVTTRVTETRLDRKPRAVVDSLRRHLARRARP